VQLQFYFCKYKRLSKGFVELIPVGWLCKRMYDEWCWAVARHCRMIRLSSFRDVAIAPVSIRMGVMVGGRFPLSLRNVEDQLHERRIEISHEIVRFWWSRLRRAEALVTDRLSSCHA